jgi:tetratricopeptide (TPR) repeat protein
MMELPLKGIIKDHSLVSLLVHLNRSRKTGTLSLSTPSFTKKIYLNAGDAIFASSTYEDDRLGEMLLKANKITVEQYDRSVELLKSAQKRLGAILVDLGYITPKDLFWGVKYQVKEIILSMFQLAEAGYDFSEGTIPRQEVITLRMSMGNLIYEGVRRIDNWTRIRNEMPDTESVLTLSSDPLSLFQDVELSAPDKKVLSLIDGKTTIREVIENSWMGSFEALKILYVLWSLGIAELKAPVPGEPLPEEVPGAGEEPVTLDDILQPPSEKEETFMKKVDSLYSRLQNMSDRELLELDEESDDETIKRNYYRLAREFHPDRYFNIADGSIKSKLTAIFDAVTAAYAALREGRRRDDSFCPIEESATGEVDKEKTADGRFKTGVAEFKKGNFQVAVDNFRQAAELMPGNSRYWNYLSLGYSKVPGRLEEAEESLMEAIKLEPLNADLYSNMGLICMKAGLKTKAHAHFEKALQINPNNEKARKGFQQSGGDT